jgi:hypothetical protein
MPSMLIRPEEIGSPATTRSLGIIAVFEWPERAEAAVETLRAAGLDLSRLSIIAKDDHSGEHLLGCASAGGRVSFWGRLSPMWNRLAQHLPGAAVVFMPFIGHLVVLGSVAAWLTEDQPAHGSAEGATRLWRLLARVGIPPYDGIAVESALREYHTLLVAAGPEADVTEARKLLRTAARRGAA